MKLTQAQRCKRWREKHPERDKADKARQQLRRGPVDEAYRQTPEYLESQKRYRASEKYKRQGRAYRLMLWFGLTLAEYQQMIYQQQGLCALCKEPLDLEKRNPPVDHDHKCCDGKKSCGKCIRGIVHQGCNVFLGFVEGHPNILEYVKEYLERR